MPEPATMDVAAAQSDHHDAAALGQRSPSATKSASETDVVLIVDDDDLVRETYDIVMRSGGWTTMLADSAQTALECLHQAGGVTVMVTDLTLSGALDGHDLIELVKAKYPAIGIVLTTGRHVAPDAFGDDVPVLLKPFRIEQLLEAARSVRGKTSPG